jgi:5-methylcytosine-specific restriction endonuclease McrA
MHPDHVIELQAGGGDWWDNLRMMHGLTNTTMGSVMQGQLTVKKSAYGTLIVIGKI